MIFAGLMLAAFSLTNCQKAEFSFSEPTKAGSKMTIGVVADQVKNTNDGIRTLWASGDGLTVFHAPAGTTEYVKDEKFTFAGEAGSTSGSFTGTMPELTPGAKYDWYVLYNYRTNLTSPIGTGVNLPAGAARPIQNGLNSSAHISGVDYLMFGKIMNAAAEDELAVKLTHVSSLIKVNVTNITSEILHPLTVEFIADGREVSGTYVIDFTGESITYTGAAPLDRVFLTVAGASVLNPGESGSFYFAVKPFSAKAGDVLELRVNGYSKKLTMTEPVDFLAGHMKEINFRYDKPVLDLSGDYIIGGWDGDDLYAAIGLALPCNPYDGGANNTVLFSKKIRLGGSKIFYDAVMSITGKGEEISPDNGIEDFKYTLTKVTEGEFAGLYTIKGPDGKFLSSSANDGGNSVDFQETPDGNSYFVINANGTDAKDGYRIIAPYASYRRHFGFNPNNNNYPRFTLFNDNDNNRLCAYLYPWGEPEMDPLPRMNDAETSVSFSGGSDIEFKVTTENNEAWGWELRVVSTSGCVTAASTFGESVLYTVSANESTEEAKIGAILIELVDPNSVYPPVQATISVTQGRRPTKSFVKVTSEPASWVGDYLIVYDGDANPLVLSMGWTGNGNQDKGDITVPVQIDGDSIAATDDLLAVRALIRNNPGTQTPANAIPGSYSIWTADAVDGVNYSATVIADYPQSTLAAGGPGHTLGAKAANCSSSIAFNSNVDNRFYQEISYDSTNNCVQIHNVPDSKKANSTGYWRFNVTERRFGIADDALAASETGTTLANIQLYKLQD